LLDSDWIHPMRLSRSRLRATLLVLSATVLFGTQTGCGDSNSSKTQAKPAIAVTTVRTSPSTEMLWVRTLGQTEGAQESEIRAQVSGTLQAITYKEGERVKAGDTLFILDDAPYVATLRSAKAAEKEARATLENATIDATRYENLFKANAASKKQRDDAIRAKKVAQAQLEKAIATVSDAQVDVDRTRVKAPADGVASRSEVNLGTLINASSTLLAKLTQPENLRVKFQLSEKDLANNTVTLENAVRLFNQQGKRIEAKLDYVSQQIDVATATRSLRATIAPNSGLVPGQLVSVQLAIDTLPNVYRVPQRAVQQLPDGSYQVFVASDGKAHARTITVGSWHETDWIVFTGLKDGDEVIIDQLQRLRDGAAITVKENSQAKP